MGDKGLVHLAKCDACGKLEYCMFAAERAVKADDYNGPSGYYVRRLEHLDVGVRTSAYYLCSEECLVFYAAQQAEEART